MKIAENNHLTKFHEDKTKIVDFLLMANFWKCAIFFSSDFKLNICFFFSL